MVRLVPTVVVAPARERGLKYRKSSYRQMNGQVAPARERGLKFEKLWPYGFNTVVAPARERGLKFVSTVIPFIQEVSLPRGSVD